MSPPPSVANFVKAFGATWFTLMSGTFSVPLAIAAYFVSNGPAKIGLAITAAVSFVVASYRLWAIERRSINVIETQIAELLGEYKYSLRIDNINIQIARHTINKETNVAISQTYRFIIAMHNTIGRPIQYEIKKLLVNDIELVDFSSRGSVITANSPATYYTSVISMEGGELPTSFKSKLEFIILYGLPSKMEGVMHKIARVSSYVSSGKATYIYELDS